MTREEAIDFLEYRRAYYASLSTDPNPHVKATKVCGYTLAESANACLMGIEALKQDTILDKIKAEIFNACSDNYHMPVYNLSCEQIFEIIDKHKTESEVEE